MTYGTTTEIFIFLEPAERKLQHWEGLGSSWVSLEPARRASEPAGRASEPAGRNLEPGERVLESVGRVSEPAGRALKPAERPLKPAIRALQSASWPFETSWEARTHLGGPAGSSKGGTERERQTNRMVCGGTIGGHRPPRAAAQKNIGSYFESWKAKGGPRGPI